ncbi:MAG: hypothetical protein LBV28_05575 [Puniceicoccales bacterium]|jgi:putative hemin transport protein|nr:hypothetical protein [Puniceicoccales bacterium]
MSLTTNKTPEELRQAWQELKAQTPHLYPRDAASKLGVAEAQLIALGNGTTSFRLEIPKLAEFLNGLSLFGEALFLVRNDAAVLEKDSVLQFEEKDHYFSATGDGVRLVFGKSSLAHAFVVHAEKWVPRGVQFFDATGTAVFKAYVRDESKIAAFDAWVKPWISPDQSPLLAVKPASDGTDLHAHAHHHHAHGTGGKSGSHCGAHCSGQPPVALPADSFKTLLTAVTKSDEPLTVSLANAHSFFSVTTTIKKVAPSGPWFNILDDALHMHLKEAAVKTAAAHIGAVGDAPKELKVAFKNETGASVLWIRVPAEGAAATEALNTKLA